MSKKLVQNEIEFEKSHSPSIDSLNNLLCLLDDARTKSIEPKNICFNYKSYDLFRKILSLYDHARKLIESGLSDISSRPWKRFKFWADSCSFMDAHADLLVHSPVEFRKKTFTGQQNKEEVEKEVNKMLPHEEKMRKYLERLHIREDMKEIVAELAMVENEIARLERQIKQLQHHKDDINVHKHTYNEWGHHRSLKDHLDASPLPPNPHMSRTTSFDTKSLHFINKTIKGDYHLTNFSANKRLIKENMFEEGGRGGLLREKNLQTK